MGFENGRLFSKNGSNLYILGGKFNVVDFNFCNVDKVLVINRWEFF